MNENSRPLSGSLNFLTRIDNESGNLTADVCLTTSTMKDAPRARPIVHLEFSIAGLNIGRVLIELFRDIVPKTAENFKCLCTGERGKGISGKPRHFKGTKVHRVIKGFAIQAGDVTSSNGMGGESIYGETFEDENLRHAHSFAQAGMVAMANAGPDTNGSQFFITMAPTPHLDGLHVVFGKVIEGFDVLRRVECVRCDEEDIPQDTVLISDCGLA